jgi:hypothetical protein
MSLPTVLAGLFDRYAGRSNMKRAHRMLLIAAGPLISASTSGTAPSGTSGSIWSSENLNFLR